MPRPRSTMMNWKPHPKAVQSFGVLLLIGASLELLTRIGGEFLWFQEVGYSTLWLQRTLTQGGIGLMVFGVTASYLLANLRLARRWKYPAPTPTPPRFSTAANLPPATPDRSPRPTPLGWPILFPLAGGASLGTIALLWYYGSIAVQSLQLSASQQFLAVPIRFQPEILGTLLSQMLAHDWAIWLGLVSVLAVLWKPQRILNGLAIGFSAIVSAILSQHWDKFLQALYANSFNVKDPVFQSDFSFYILQLPIAQLFEFWLTGLAFFGFVSVALVYLLSANSLSEGKFPGFSWSQKRHLYGLGSVLMGVVALGYWLSRYELLYSSRGVTFGASYTDLTVQLPADTLLSLLAGAIGLYFLWRNRFWPQEPSSRRRVVYLVGIYLALAGLLGAGLPTLVQSAIVQPNELARERPYIERTIALTRKAFNLDNIDVQPFNPQGKLTEADLQTNDLTIRNIRLWDERPLLETNRQLQQIRSYYRFPGADIDRYVLPETGTQPSAQSRQPTPAPSNAASSREQRQILIAARELDYAGVPKQAQTWVNRHLIYTHGYGFTLSPVNTVGVGGLPEYFVKDLGVGPGGSLSTSSEAIRNSIPIGQPRIYYGELTNSYVMTGTRVQELDYPSGSDNVYNTYDGQGGIQIGTGWKRWLFAKYLNDWRMAITPEFLPQTRLLMRRNIYDRIQAIAPFLRYDRDPYLVVTDVNAGKTNAINPGGKSAPSPNYLYWVIDAYTISDHAPYSDPGEDQINYIRNSVKVVIDAYNGSVNFYIADSTDPVIQTWAKIFPTLLKPLTAMPQPLQQHLRYPIDFFNIQSQRLMTYHMTDPQVFYNREDEWQIPTEIYGDQLQPVKPYYLITSLPTEPFEEFLLLRPFTPRQRTNLVAWLAARSDGTHYGKLLLYIFPKERLIYGPEQIEARINQDPVISQQISLWNRQGSRAIQGNLLVIPIEQSLLYVEPLYLEATQNSLPTLVRVIVAYENQIVMAPTLDQALAALFQTQKPSQPTIVRPVEPPSRP
ncbi:UPF0182 family protein [Alkalinema sp. FACHB-956]|uniref:UPF0182 family protein n=1 Tax=Alkalinema sp. FACHB-956 TaxID=2692768 RepID=UPI001F552BA6|nr:UPF0182 family protein [Alkalinema sp. FACHB-956]